MALTNAQALDVVAGSIKSVSGRTVGPDDELEADGGIDDARLRLLITTIVTDDAVGVGKFDHEIAASALDGIGTDDTVRDVADVVRDNATPRA